MVDTIDLVLDQLDEDPGWAFLLDGQTVVLEDYLAVRPGRRAQLERACRAGRLAIGPWYVQPDSLLPSAEAHVRNLLEGRRAGEEVGPVSRVGYTPDSFGHPAQMPHLFAGFGIESFVYWRGNGNELGELGPTYRWVAPSGASVVACLLAEGYFAAAYLGEDAERAATRLESLVRKLADPSRDDILLMNGIDHAPPDSATAAIAETLAANTGWDVRRGLLEDHLARVRTPDKGFTGELTGAKISNLLPGVWSTRMPLKARNRRVQTALEGWAEPFAALALLHGLDDERPSLRSAWRTLLVNQAHDSICGCSTDAVHEQMLGRYDSAIGLAAETTQRVLERLAGLGPRRRVVWRDGFDVAVWNPSPHPVTDVVRVPMDGHPLFMIGSPDEEIHPLVMASLMQPGMTVDGTPARLIRSTDPGRVRMIPEQEVWDVELVAHDVPAFGWRRFHLRPGVAPQAEEDEGREISIDDLSVVVEADGTVTVATPAGRWSGLLGLEDVGDRGDSYDHDPVDGPPLAVRVDEVRRTRHPHGVQQLAVRRSLTLPRRLDASFTSRSAETIASTLDMTVTLVPGTGRIDVDLEIDNTAEDHRLRLLFPVGGTEADASTTFDVVARGITGVDDHGWVQPAGRTFVHQGWIASGGLAVAAPDLPEAELLADGTVALTLLRCVGWLSRMDLHSRPLPAGPGMPAPGAQCLGAFRTTLHLWPGGTLAQARAAELGLHAVPAGPAGPIPEDEAQLLVEPSGLVISAVKPAEHDDGVVVRVLNAGDDRVDATLTLATPPRHASRIRLDEQQVEEAIRVDQAKVIFPVDAHSTATILIR